MSLLRPTRGRFAGMPLTLLLVGLAAVVVDPTLTQTLEPTEFPGGFIEKATSIVTRPRLTSLQIQALLPSRGDFTFPAPWGTEAVRLTNAADCGGGDCVNYVGY